MIGLVGKEFRAIIGKSLKHQSSTNNGRHLDFVRDSSFLLDHGTSTRRENVRNVGVGIVRHHSDVLQSTNRSCSQLPTVTAILRL